MLVSEKIFPICSTHRILQKTLDDLEEFRHKHQALEEQQRELFSHRRQTEPEFNIHINFDTFASNVKKKDGDPDGKNCKFL